MESIKNTLKRIIPKKWWGFCRAYLKQQFTYGTILVCKWPKKYFHIECMNGFEHSMGYRFDINNPKTFNEKVVWYKCFYDVSGIPYITDKVTFKDYVEKHIGKGYTIPTYGHWCNIRKFVKDWEKLPNQFVLKSNISSGGDNIVIIQDKSKVDLNKLTDELKKWLDPFNTLLNTPEWRMYNSKPQILAEQYLTNGNNVLSDYKLFCFDGKPYCAYMATKKQTITEEHSITFYDLNWTKLDVTYGNHSTCDNEKPIHWEEMKEIAAKLSKGFPMVRVDFFDTEKQLYLAEMTFNPGGGGIPYHPASFSETMGDLFILPIDK